MERKEYWDFMTYRLANSTSWTGVSKAADPTRPSAHVHIVATNPLQEEPHSMTSDVTFDQQS